MLFGLRAGRGVIWAYSGRGQRACDAGTPMPCCGRRADCEPHPEQPGPAVARERTRRSGYPGHCDNDCAGRISAGARRCRRCDFLRGGERNLFVSFAARTDDPRFSRVVGRALLSAARHRRAPPDRWLLTGTLAGYQWLPAIVFAPTFALWLLIKGVATPGRREMS